MRRDTFGIALAGALVVLGGACTDGGDPLIILQNQVPGDGCTISASQSDTFISRGLIDTQADTGYLFNPIVQNNAVDPTTSTAPPRIATIQGAEVSLTPQAGFNLSVDDSLLHFTRKFGGTIQPSGGVTAFSFVILDKALLDAIGQSLAVGDDPVEVDAKITVFGNLNGTGVESQPFSYPVLVCNGCMQRTVGTCATLAADFVASTGGQCNTLQDVYTDCCTAADGSLTCPAVPPAGTP